MKKASQLLHGVYGTNSQAKTHGVLAGFAVLLLAAIFTFTGCPIDPDPGPENPTVDKAALTAAINAANTAKSSVVVNTAAGNVSLGTNWVTEAEMTALTTAITAAEAVKDKADATQTEVDNATTALTTATSAFNTAKKDGTSTGSTAGDKASLEAAITAANTAKSSVAIDTNAGNVPLGTKWVTEAEMTAFNTAIISAEAVKNNADATPAEVNNAITALTTATSAFNTAIKTGNNTEIVAADKTALITAISQANNVKGSAVVNTAAENVPAGTNWVTQDEMSALTNAITSAEAVKNKAAATQSEVDNATTALTTAMATFTNAIKDGTSTESVATDKDVLQTMINVAKAGKIGVVINTAEENVSAGTKWVTEADMTAFDNAITEAQAVMDSTAATPAEVSAAITAMTTATAAFNDAKKEGTKTGSVAGDKTVLQTMINAAKAGKIGVVINTAEENVSAGTKWVTEAEMTAFDNAITEAQAVMDSTAATPAEVSAAITAMTTATAAFNDAKKDGTKTGSVAVDKTALNNAISAANTAKNGVVTSSEDGKDKAPGTKWVPQATMTVFTNAIAKAQTEADSDAATQDAVDTAVMELNDAKSTFTNAIQTAETSKSYLDTAISNAESAPYDITVSDTDPGTGSKWVPLADMTNFTNAIDAAKAVKSDPAATQNAVDDAVSTLDTARTTFNSKVKNVTHGTVEGNLTITLWENNGSITDPIDSTTISKATKESFTARVTSTSGYPSSVQWYVNGVQISGTTAISITISAADYSPGTYRLGVTAFKGDIPYAAEISFTVTN
ncbi:MAG: FIVAR domain-containing protein [Treponema sp.]|nr:FIVAR domain-containing protein [Treponema sp.]